MLLTIFSNNLIAAGVVLASGLGWFFISIYRKNKKMIVPETVITNAFKKLEERIKNTSTPTELSYFDDAIDDFFILFSGRNLIYTTECFQTLVKEYNKRMFQLRPRHTAT